MNKSFEINSTLVDFEKWKCWSLSHVWLFVTPWTVARQAPLSKEFSRPEYWSGSPFPSPGDLPNPGIESMSPALQADSVPSEPLRRKPFTFLKDLYTSISQPFPCYFKHVYFWNYKELVKCAFLISLEDEDGRKVRGGAAQRRKFWKSDPEEDRTVYVFMILKVKALVTQPCLTLCGLMDCSLPGSSVQGILQARMLEVDWMWEEKGKTEDEVVGWHHLLDGHEFE